MLPASSGPAGSVPRPLYVQEPELMDSYAEAFAKVLDNLDTVLGLEFEPYPRPTDAPCSAGPARNVCLRPSEPEKKGKS